MVAIANKASTQTDMDKLIKYLETQKPPDVPSIGESTAASMQALIGGVEPLAVALRNARAQLGLGAGMQPDISSLEQRLPQLSKITSALEKQGTASTLANMQGLAPGIQDVITRSQSPEAVALRAQLNKLASSELAAGTLLTPEERRVTEQGLRSSEMARGVSSGQGGANREAVAKALQGRSLQRERQAMAESRLSSEQSMLMNPYQAYGSLNNSSQAPLNLYSGILGQYQNPLGGSQTALSAGGNQQALQLQNAQTQGQFGLLTTLAPYMLGTSGGTGSSGGGSKNSGWTVGPYLSTPAIPKLW